MCVCVRAQSLSWIQLFANPMDCSPPGSFVHGGFLEEYTGVGFPFLLQRIFLTQASNTHFQCLLHCRQILYCWATREASLSVWTSKALYLILYPKLFCSFSLKNDLKLHKLCSHKTWIQPWVWGLNVNHYQKLSVEIGRSLSVRDQS